MTRQSSPSIKFIFIKSLIYIILHRELFRLEGKVTRSSYGTNKRRAGGSPLFLLLMTSFPNTLREAMCHFDSERPLLLLQYCLKDVCVLIPVSGGQKLKVKGELKSIICLAA